MSTPSAPIINELPLSSANALEFDWDPPATPNGTISGYRLQLNSETPIDLPASASSYLVTGLVNNTPYTATITAQNENGYGATATFLTFRPGTAAPAAPSTMYVSVSSNTAVVNWTRPLTTPDSDILWYTIYANSTTTPSDPEASFSANGLTQTSRYIKLPSANYDTFSLNAVNCPGYSPAISYIKPLAEIRQASAVGPYFISIIYDSKTDSSGNYYVCGNYIASPGFVVKNLDGTNSTVSLPPTNLNAAFLIKYNSSGIAVWATTLDGPAVASSNDFFYSIAFDSSNNVYVGGYYTAVSSLRVMDASTTGGTPSQITLPSNGNTNVACLIKYSTNGIALWATTLAGASSAGNAIINWISIDNSDRINITGQYGIAAASISVNNQSSTGGTASGITLPTTGGNFSYAAFLIQYNTSGTAVWATTLNGTSNDRPYAIDYDLSGNIYWTGNYNSTTTVTVNNQSSTGGTASGITLPSTAAAYLFLLKYNSAGTVIWATTFNPTSIGYSVAVDRSSYAVYLISNYTSGSGTNAVLNQSSTGGTASGITVPNTSGSASLIVKYNSAGTVLWATTINGSGTDIPYQGKIDLSGNLYISGVYNSTTTVAVNNQSSTGGTASGITLPITTGNAVFLVKYNSAGTVLWATSMDGTAGDFGYSVAVDSSYNIYLAGQYDSTSTVTVNNQSATGGTPSGITIPSASTSAFILKYNANGTAISGIGLGGVQFVTSIINSSCRDSANNLIVCGNYSVAYPTTLYNLNGTLSSISLPLVSTQAVFLIKYNSSGSVLWATHLNGTGTDSGLGVTVDGSDNIYFCGPYVSSSTVAVNNQSSTGGTASGITLPITTAAAVFLVKYNSAGTVLWATSLNGTGADTGRSVATDSAGSVYITGDYISTSTVAVNTQSSTGGTPSGITLPIRSTTTAVFLIKYNSAGTASWAVVLDGASTDTGYSVTVDPSDNVYITGLYNSTAATTNVNNQSSTGGSASGITLPITVSNAVYLVKYNSSGTVLWATSLNGTGSDIGYMTGCDLSGNVYIAGQYISTGTVNVNNQNATGGTASGITLPIATTAGTYLIKYNSAGTALWATNFKGTGTTIGWSLVTDANRNVYVAGTYVSSSDVTVQNQSATGGSASSITIPAASTNGLFLIKYNANGTALWGTYFDTLNGAEFPYALTTDSNNNLYMSGSFISAWRFKLFNPIPTTQQQSSLILGAASPTQATAYVIKFSQA